MTSILSLAHPLPTCLEATVPVTAGRRYHVANDVVVSIRALERFNALLAQLGVPAPIERDGLSTAARALATDRCATPACIRQRLRRARAAASMAADRQWGPSQQAVSTMRLVSGYIASRDDVIPDHVPTIGRLDDAIVVEAAWPGLDDEVGDYLRFHRMRRELALTRDERRRFDREAWLRARREERALWRQLGRVRTSSYLQSPPSVFLVH